MRIYNNLKKNTGEVTSAFARLDSSVRKRLYKLVVAQCGMAFLDLVGVILVGIVGALSAGKILGQTQNQYVDRMVGILNLESVSLNSQVLIISSCALTILTARSILTILISKKILLFLSITAGKMTVDFFRLLSKMPSAFIRANREQEILSALVSGPQVIVIGVIFSCVTILSDLFMMAVMLMLIILVQPLTALSTLIFFSFIGILLHKFTNKKIRKFGSLETQAILDVQESILETMEIFEQLELTNKKDFLLQRIERDRQKAAYATAELQFLPGIGKYVLETTVVIGGFLIAGIQLFVSDVTGAITALAIFIVSASRIAPSAMRVQQNVGILIGSLSRLEPFLAIIDRLKQTSARGEEFKGQNTGFHGVEVENVSFKYPTQDKAVLEGLTFKIKRGSFVAFIGPSGAGKSTIAKLILGTISPDVGEVLIDGMKPYEIHQKQAGALAYVPQDISLIRGGFIENVALGQNQGDVNIEFVKECLDRVGLLEVYQNHQDTPLHKLELSGGQKQRLAIARSLYTKPEIIVLDEPTSALDISMEQEITRNVYSRSNHETVIVIAHRLQTIVQADEVFYIKDGEIAARGTFEEIKAQVPDVLMQSNLIGL